MPPYLPFGSRFAKRDTRFRSSLPAGPGDERLAEQLYRAEAILRGHPYHRG